MGTAAARSLVEKGYQTLLLERFTIGHSRGSSGGPTRIFRITNEHPHYVRMARLALDAWRELEEVAGERLLFTTGGIDIGEPARVSAEALEAAGEDYEYLAPDAAMERWPGLRFSPGTELFVQEEGGVCMAERTVRAQARLALERGATVMEETNVTSIGATGESVTVHTANQAFRAPVAIATVGPWAGPLLASAHRALPLVPSLEQVTYFALEAPSPLPTMIDWIQAPAQTTSAVPHPEESGHYKVFLHKSGPSVDAEGRSFDPDPERVARVEAYVTTRFSRSYVTEPTETCLYTNAPDDEFVLDRVGPLVVGSPCSGRGFKFAPLIGQILTALAIGAPTPVPVGRYSATRAALQKLRY